MRCCFACVGVCTESLCCVRRDQLMHQSHAVFQDLQTRVRTCPRRSEQLRLRLLAASRRYRGQYDACIGDMDDECVLCRAWCGRDPVSLC